MEYSRTMRQGARAGTTTTTQQQQQEPAATTYIVSKYVVHDKLDALFLPTRTFLVDVGWCLGLFSRLTLLPSTRLWIGMDGDAVVDSQDGDSGFGGETEHFDLGDGRFHDARLEIVPDRPIRQVQAVVLPRQFFVVCTASGLVRSTGVVRLLSLGVCSAELRHQIRCIEGSIDGQLAWDDQQRIGKRSDRKSVV